MELLCLNEQNLDINNDTKYLHLYNVANVQMYINRFSSYRNIFITFCERFEKVVLDHIIICITAALAELPL